jgi:hypothetical protein
VAGSCAHGDEPFSFQKMVEMCSGSVGQAELTVAAGCIGSRG